MNCLTIAAGPDRRSGWKTLDANPANEPDFVASVPPLPEAVRLVSWDEIELIHGIEHFFAWDAAALLREIHEVLRPDGLLTLEQPNIEFCARVLLGLENLPYGSPGQFDMWGLYGDPNHRNPLMGHHWGYTPRTLAEALIAAGFNRDKIVQQPARHHRPGRDFRIEARK